MATEEVAAAAAASYEDLALIEDEFDRIDTEIMKQQWTLSKEAYARRAQILSRIPNFWTLVLEASPPEIDSFIHPRDSKLFAESLKSLSVQRFELEEEEEKGNSSKASPRSFAIRMEFGENDTFEDTVLEKKFWFRRASDGWSGLVSAPVKIHWKKGKDLSEGLTDKAFDLFTAREKSGDMLKKDLPEYAALKKLVEHWNGANTTFFTFFGFVSSRRWVSAAESEKASQEATERFQKRRRGEKFEDSDEPADEEDVDANDDTEVEVFENGDDLATTIAEEIWPNATKYFTESQEMDDEELSELDFEEMGDDDDDDDDDDEGQPIDIRALVQDKSVKRKRQSDGALPAKNQKK